MARSAPAGSGRGRGGVRRHAGTAAAGFTVVELVVVIVVLGILALVALPRIVDRGLFDVAGVADQTRGGLRYAQKLAIAQRRNVCVVIAGGSLSLRYDGAAPGSCNGAAVAEPGSTQAYVVGPVAGVVITGPAFRFDNAQSGAPVPPGPHVITVNGGAASGTRTITIEAGTGHVHSP